MPEDEFERELTHFEELRTELTGRATSVAPTIKLDGISAIWKRSTPGERRKLLLSFFDRLHVRDGRIDHCVARADRRDEVQTLVALATGGQPEGEVLAPIPQSGRPDLIAKRGAGGICLRSTLRRRAMHLSPDRSNEMDHWNTENVDWQDDSLAGCPLRKAGN